MAIQHLSAVTLAIRDMSSALAFYQRLGFEQTYGAVDQSFVSLRAGDAHVNLALTPAYHYCWWGRVIFRVDDVDALHRSFVAAGLRPDPPRDAEWGERYFHLTDPDGHELSFAQTLPATDESRGPSR